MRVRWWPAALVVAVAALLLGVTWLGTADVLEQLRKAGLEEETIIFYFADHGSGMPRHKRWPYNSGLHVPLIIHVPEKFKSIALKEHVLGGSTERLVSFVDLAPTALSLCGIQPPSHMQGRAFLGEFTKEPKSFLHGFRGRMDERIDMVRSVRDKRFIYIRNYLPHRIYGQHVEYMFQTPTTRVWKQRFDQGKLNEIQSRFWKAKPAEELYDLESDPDETKNLADSPDHVAIKSRLQNAQRELALQIRDLGFMPEGEIHRRSGDQSPYDMARDEIEYPIASILSAAEKASSLKVAKSMDLLPLSHRDSAVRYWAAIQRLNQDKAARSKYETQLQRLIESDDSPDVRVAAAEVLIHSEQPAQFGFALESLIKTAKTINQGPFPAIAALNAIDSIQVIDRLSNDQKRDLVASLHGLGVEYPEAHKRYQGYVARLVKHILTELNER